MTVRTVNNLPAATHGETVRRLFCNRIEQKELDHWIYYAANPRSIRKMIYTTNAVEALQYKGVLI